jgi:hypothetical protein
MELDPDIHIGSTWFVLETGCDIKAGSCFKKSMPGRADIMLVRELLSGKPSNKVFTRQPKWLTPRTSCGVVKGVSSMHNKPTSQSMHSKPSPSRGLLPYGG